MTVKINLIPPEYRDSKKPERKKGHPYALCIIVLVMCLLTVLFAYRQISLLTSRINETKAGIAQNKRRLADAKREYESAVSNLAGAESRLDFLLSGLQPSRLLPELSAMLPQNVSLNSLKLHKNRMVITGTAETAAAVSALVQNLSASNLIKSVSVPQLSRSQLSSGKYRQRFSLQCALYDMDKIEPEKLGGAI